VTAVLAAIVRLQFVKPVQAPDHPANVLPEAAVDVNTTAAPLEKLAVQVPGQLIPAGLLVTVPPPVPALTTVSWIPPLLDPTVTFADAVAVPPLPVAVAV
jgi:hypothetical protein